MSRAIISAEPPGANGQTKVIGLSGYDWAKTVVFVISKEVIKAVINLFTIFLSGVNVQNCI
jgi:hypothetical protein